MVAKRDEHEQFYLHKIEPVGGFRDLTEVGIRKPLYYGLGRAILAFLDERLWQQYVPAEIPAYSMRTVVDRDAFIEDLKRIRHMGYAVEKGEYREGVIGVGVPIFRQPNEAWGLIGVALPGSRFDAEKERVLVNLLTRASKAITLETSKLARK